MTGSGLERPTAHGPRSAGPDGERDWVLPLVLWAAVTGCLLAIQLVTEGSAGEGRILFAGWMRWDVLEYLDIARDGYEQRQLVWFPVFPLLIRALTFVLRDRVVAAVVTSLAGGAVASLLYWRWLDGKLRGGAQRVTALLVLLLYPYAWYLAGVPYSDAVFLALALGAFLLVERDRYLLAGLVGVVATATRPSGWAVTVGLFLVACERSGVLSRRESAHPWLAKLRVPTAVDLRRLRSGAAWTLVSLCGLAGFVVYQWVAWGSPVRYITEQANYHDFETASLLKAQYFTAWYEGASGSHLATTTLQAVVLAFVLLAVPAVGRRFGWGYAGYVLALAAMPAFSVSTFMGVGRYLLPAFPTFALVGEWLAGHRVARVVWLGMSGAVLLLWGYGFARGWYLS